jgi:hypothetical protein
LVQFSKFAAARITGDYRRLHTHRVLLGAVDFCMFANCVFRMIVRMEMVRVCDMRVMGSFLMVAGFVMLCRFGVMVCSLRVVVGCLCVVMRGFL